MTASELLKKLARDPEFTARQAKRNEEHARLVAPSLKVQEEVLADLSSQGVNASSLAQLGACGDVPSKAVNVLLGWLSRTEDPNIQAGIVQTLGAANSPFDGTQLARLFDCQCDVSLRWTIANTIECAHPEGLTVWLEQRLGDSTLGRAREMLAVAAGQMLAPSTAKDLLRKVFSELPGHCAMGLGDCGDREEMEFLISEQDKHKGWVRQEIKKAIEKIRSRHGEAGET